MFLNFCRIINKNYVSVRADFYIPLIENSMQMTPTKESFRKLVNVLGTTILRTPEKYRPPLTSLEEINSGGQHE